MQSAEADSICGNVLAAAGAVQDALSPDAISSGAEAEPTTSRAALPHDRYLHDSAASSSDQHTSPGIYSMQHPTSSNDCMLCRFYNPDPALTDLCCCLGASFAHCLGIAYTGEEKCN